ncbi:MAG: UDP-3-O-acyl-N-acetylglucosamine deacetylase [Pseudomonadales bacterium]
MVDRQRTLRNVVHCTGRGRSQSALVRVALKPAPADHGIVFARVDLSPVALVPVSLRAVAGGNFSTALTHAGVSVSGVSPLLAACSGLGLNNLLIELDGPELPAMDGSAAPFVFLLEAAGSVRQNVPRRYLRVAKSVRLQEGEAWAELRPHSGLHLDYALDFDGAGGARERRSAAVELSTTAFVRDLARARSPLVAPESAGAAGREWLRHKLMHALGDLSLLGQGLIGAFSGFASGHTLHRLLLEKFLMDPDAWEQVTLSTSDQGDADANILNATEVPEFA